MCSNAITITISTMWDRRVHSLLNKTLPVYSVLVFLTPTNQNKTATAKLKNSSSPQTSFYLTTFILYMSVALVQYSDCLFAQPPPPAELCWEGNEAFKSQPRDIMSPACWWVFPWISFRQDMPKNTSPKVFRRHFSCILPLPSILILR